MRVSAGERCRRDVVEIGRQAVGVIYTWMERALVDPATGMARMFGSSQVELVDLLQALATDLAMAASVTLSVNGLSEQSIIDWRRRMAESVPVLSTKEGEISAAVDDVLSDVRDAGPFLYRPMHHAVTAVEVVARADEDPLLRRLFADMHIDGAALLAQLLQDRDVAPRAVIRGSANAYRREGVLVLLPVRREATALGAEAGPREGVIVAPDTSFEQLGERVLETLSAAASSPPAEDAGCTPFHEVLGFKTDKLFRRKARLVMVSRHSASVELSPTMRRNANRFDGMAGVVSLRAAADRPEAIGEALRRAFDECIDAS